VIENQDTCSASDAGGKQLKLDTLRNSLSAILMDMVTMAKKMGMKAGLMERTHVHAI
jgi:hypothetical protein